MTIRAATSEAVSEAARFIRRGGLVAFPTETVYGLGADATHDLAVAAIFSTKGRPTFNPLIVHVPNLTVAGRFVPVGARAEALARIFWPGPLTFVLPRLPDSPISHLATAGLDTIAVRCPAHPVALALLAEARTPIAAPSANRSGHVSPTSAQHVADDFGDRVDIVLDGGPSEIGVESTVLDLSAEQPRLLRPGGVPVEDIEAVLGELVQRATADSARPVSPGQLESHYAPRASLRMNAVDTRGDEGLLAFGQPIASSSRLVENLSPRGDLLEAAANLFAALRRLDQTGVGSIAVMSIPDKGLGAAINDRLRRASAPR
jgi:L-threonylcarbamoyladenylate synthase